MIYQLAFATFQKKGSQSWYIYNIYIYTIYKYNDIQIFVYIIYYVYYLYYICNIFNIYLIYIYIHMSCKLNNLYIKITG